MWHPLGSLIPRHAGKYSTVSQVLGLRKPSSESLICQAVYWSIGFPLPWCSVSTPLFSVVWFLLWSVPWVFCRLGFIVSWAMLCLLFWLLGFHYSFSFCCSLWKYFFSVNCYCCCCCCSFFYITTTQLHNVKSASWKFEYNSMYSYTFSVYSATGVQYWHYYENELF